MGLTHIIVSGHEFIGEVNNEDLLPDRPVFKVKKAVKLVFVNSPQGLRVHMNNLLNNNNYVGDVLVLKGGGQIVTIPLQEMGSLARQYREAISDIQIVEPKIKVVTH